MEIRDIKKTSISSEEEINHTMKVVEADKKDEDILPGYPDNNLQGEEEKDKLEVFEILRLLLSDF